MGHINIGSRASALAVVQSELVRDALASSLPGWSFEIKTYKTTGDKILDRPLDAVGGKGLFTKELESALLAGEVDILVHSFKDVPMLVDERIPIAAAAKRADDRDVLVLPEGHAELDRSKPLGCSSKRRAIQLKKLWPDIKIAPVRGNVLTRLSKLDSGEFSALVLASAGLTRLGLEGRISRYFTVDEILPAACQGILAIQARNDFDRNLLKGVHDPDTWLAAISERAFVRALDGGCTAPTAAHAVIKDGGMTVTGLYVPDGSEKAVFASISGRTEDAEKLGTELSRIVRKDENV